VESFQVTWQDTFIRFGGSDLMRAILQFNHTTQNWTTVAQYSSPFNIMNSGCALISDQVKLLSQQLA
jgi:hypothetical protein